MSGVSSSQGTIWYDRNINGVNSVYGRLTDEGPQIITGTYEELKKIMDEADGAYAKPGSRMVFFVFFALLAAVIAAFRLAGLQLGFAALVFCIIAYFPIMILIYAAADSYTEPELKMQMRRYHGTEHCIYNFYWDKKRDFTIECLKKQSFIAAECGTVYAGSTIVWAFLLAVIIMNIQTIGIIYSILLAIGSAIGIFAAMILLPFYPLRYLQFLNVAKPTEEMYGLGMEIILAMEELRAKE